ncbi:MAG: hypothetical protein N2378_16820, partial [Chloroflexaceae bacterium]|nr:hypothetical protein [Chloroflexaceae bacterium]
MAAETAANTTASERPRRRYARIAPLYKALIWTSFLINAVLIVIVGILVGIVINHRGQVASVAANAQVFAANNLAELQDVVGDLQRSTIVYTCLLYTS